MFGIAKRENKGLLAGLYEFPSIAGHFNKKELEEKLAEDGIIVKKMQSLGAGKHIFSRYVRNAVGKLYVSSTSSSEAKISSGCFPVGDSSIRYPFICHSI